MLLPLQSSLLMGAPGNLGSLPALPLPPGPQMSLGLIPWCRLSCPLAPSPMQGRGSIQTLLLYFAASRALIPHIVYSSPEGRGMLVLPLSAAEQRQLEEVFLKLPLSRGCHGLAAQP